ncbi:hypothetical protein A3J23_02240 [Candidatus Peregrinibacteria bacterium RIFCSPLOWO2_02_FULL_48_14]|nr:MAG: hypothetical protein A3J23_02240 [Candidatus Peregrinibacteria bacterium RIFCSPLOWO2_02_FULL_48_14]
MQKFTVFSILLSLAVILGIADIIFNDYLNGEASVTPVVEEDYLPIEEEVIEEEIIEEENGGEEVDLSEDQAFLEPNLGLELFEESGFSSPVLKDTIFSGLVFQFISFSDQKDATIYQWNLFDGEQYIGSIYEIRYATETGSFQGYLSLRERAGGLANLGTVNEVNNYGDASFYFNHKTKVKTIHLVFRSGASIYAFEYSQSAHDKMKKAFDRTASLL